MARLFPSGNPIRNPFQILVAFGALLALFASGFGQGGVSQEARGSLQPAVSNDSASRTKQATGILEFRAYDVETGIAVRATATIQSLEQGQFGPKTFLSDEFGRFHLEVPVGRYLTEVCAPGYMRMRSHHDVLLSRGYSMGYMLHPEIPPKEMRPELTDAQMQPNRTLMAGYIVDAETGMPLPNVRVRIEKARVETTTNTRGFYSVSVPSPPTEMVNTFTFPGTDNIIIELKGYKTFIGKNMDFPSGEFIESGWALQRGEGTEEHDYTHKLRRADSGGVAQESTTTGEPQNPRILAWNSIPSTPCGLRTQDRLPVIRTIRIRRPEIVVYGTNLSKVEVWAIPDGKEDKPDEYELLGGPARYGYYAAEGETWPFKIPWWLNNGSDPLRAVEVFAKAFDAKGNLVGKRSLPYKGVAALTKALWGPDAVPSDYSTVFEIREGYSGEQLVYSAGTTFDVVLDETKYPQSYLTLNCSPAKVLRAVPEVPQVFESLYTVRYEAMESGSCTIADRGFSVSIVVK